MDKITYDAIYKAVHQAIKELGPDYKGMSCFLSNWGDIKIKENLSKGNKF
jgi:hypothetical protein